MSASHFSCRVFLFLSCFAFGEVRAQSATNLECQGCVGRGDIAAGAVSGGKISAGAVTTPKIQAGAVTLDRLAPDVQAMLMAPESEGPYSPTVVRVDCDGTGTPLNDAIKALNPVSAVYEVQVSGICEEDLILANFQSIKIRSVDPASPATIGRVHLDSGTSYAELSGIRVKTRGTPPGGRVTQVIQNNSGGGRLQIQDVEIVCDPSEGATCNEPVSIAAGNARLNGMIFTGPWTEDEAGRKGKVFVNRGGYALLQRSGCLDLAAIEATAMSTLYVIDGNSAVQGEKCEIGTLTASVGATITFAGRAAQVKVSNATIYGYSEEGSGKWFQSILCDGVTRIAADADGDVNYCAP